jgi:hypothetical protein
MDKTKSQQQDKPWVSPHVAKRDAKRKRAEARRQKEANPSYIKGVWELFKGLFSTEKKPHVHVPTPEKVRSATASTIRAINRYRCWPW